MLEKEKCYASLEDCIHYRRCFMSGEYCSKQANIQKERERLHAEGKINAFVIMNFSNMSNVVYKWRIKPFIESLKNYLWIEGGTIVCCSERTQEPKSEKQTEAKTGGKVSETALSDGAMEVQNPPESPQKVEKTPVEQINVIRADSDTASNYVVCNRICQQMQVADLIIVDVSFENTNVFYEFGMAVALGKLILPICYSESFFEVRFPEKLAERMESETVDEEIKRHIDCYPWRRTLFEHFGIRYRSKADSDDLGDAPQPPKGEQRQGWRELNENLNIVTKYLKFDIATDSKYGFSDIQYRKFPYLESADDAKTSENGGNTIGKKIYTRLGNTYNNSRYLHNTLVVYTLEGFLNEAQAGQCIINFYKYITSQMKDQHCFCGDRVGTLIQTISIPEDVKDAKTEKHLLYNVGEIIQLGTNEATYAAQRETIKTDDFLSVPKDILGRDDNPNWVEEIRTFTKGYVGNRSISVYPRTPVYVKRIKNGLQRDITEVEDDSWLHYYFCLFHVMLQTLKYTNELVVDISKTPLESLFWLGAAHGSDVNAITVRYEESESERVILTGASEKQERPIFDVAGLWSAILRSHDTEGFYRQLALAQKGIEQHSKLMLKDLEYYEDQLVDSLYRDLHEGKERSKVNADSQNRISGILKRKEAQDLESYYRDRFWKPMLGRDHLRIYLPQVDGTDNQRKEPKLNAVKWDVEAIATLSHYLSIRTHIGEYSFQTIGKNEVGEGAKTSNFITVGNDAKPLGGNAGATISLAEYIQSKFSQSTPDNKSPKLGDGGIHQHWEYFGKKECTEGEKRLFKGFIWDKFQDAEMFYTQLPQSYCYQCMSSGASQEAGETPFSELKENDQGECFLKGKKNVHSQLAQLVLWREVDRSKNEVWLWVSITGTSGPSTLALSTILVNESQRAMKFHLDKNALTNAENQELQNYRDLTGADLKDMEHPLSDLQKLVRRNFIDAFIKLLNHEVKEPKAGKPEEKKTCEEYARKIKYSAVLYLSSILYRYFLPFLSLADEEKMLHGMRYFLFSLLASETIPYPATGENQEALKRTGENQIVKEAVKAFEKVLHSFQGVEALYRVKVKVNEPKNCDSRESLCICPLEGASVNCLFV